MAERVGFEPTLPCGKHAFQACAFSHSAISPDKYVCYVAYAGRRQLSAFVSVAEPGARLSQLIAYESVDRFRSGSGIFSSCHSVLSFGLSAQQSHMPSLAIVSPRCLPNVTRHTPQKLTRLQANWPPLSLNQRRQVSPNLRHPLHRHTPSHLHRLRWGFRCRYVYGRIV